MTSLLCRFADEGDEAQESTVKPSHMTFHHMLYGWGNARDPKQGVTTLDAMRDAGLEPTQTAYRLVIEGCVLLSYYTRVEHCPAPPERQDSWANQVLSAELPKGGWGRPAWGWGPGTPTTGWTPRHTWSRRWRWRRRASRW